MKLPSKFLPAHRFLYFIGAAVLISFGTSVVLLVAASSNKLNLQEQALPPVTNSAVFATHNQIQQASNLRCPSTLKVQAYACPVGSGPNPTIGTPVLGMEIQFIADVPCVATQAPFPCTVNVETSGAFSVFVNNGSTAPTPATFGAGFHRIAGGLIANQLVWRLEY